MAKCCLWSLNKTFAHEGATNTSGALVARSCSSRLCAGAHVCIGCAESRALKCFKNSRKLKAGLSQRRKSCNNLLCLRGVQGREWRSVRNQDQVPFSGTCKFKGKVTLGHQRPAEAGAGPPQHQCSHKPAPRPCPCPCVLDSNPAPLQAWAFHPELAVSQENWDWARGRAAG